MSAVPHCAVAGDVSGRPVERTCAHLGQVRAVEPATPGACEDCLREGTQWVHLRLCLECGHVGCCDNSPRRHATAHFRHSSHPIMRSEEPGEDWAWCYPDELFLLPA
ncbi:MAG TPA: UBP-type zinc finger domain-containing protein [Acidimicrobiales bacterium]|nr:UBP-type zinc finger domain-containing protein [Acidimicrobiales bacterium]